MRVDLDGRVGTCYRAQAATDTSRRIVNHGVEIAALGNFFRHRKDLLRASSYAKFTAFTVVFINRYSGHIINSSRIDRLAIGILTPIPMASA